MTSDAPGDPDRYEAELEQRQARSRGILLGVTLGLLGAGALCGVLALVLAQPVREHPGLFGVLLAIGLSLVVAGTISALQLRGSPGLDAADDALGRLVPRVLGGKKPEQLDRHRRHRSRRGRG